ncbi:integral peroxisomal membrane peroxin-domain-containing protein [Hysterangium stoloniferum]|nr:integral peroxisomal membrane peroxin-domain-containing protein [Hysterangium stoloniferum]
MSTNTPNLLHFLDSVPPPVTLLLVELAPTIRLLRRGAEVLSWNSHWSEAWLVLAAWWGLCLTTYTFTRYLVPFTLLLPALWKYLPRSPSQPIQPTTEQALANALSDLTIFRTLLPSLPPAPSSLHHLIIALRLSAMLYFPYVIIIYLVPFPVILGLAGTFVITYRARWACTIRTVLGRSAYIQWALSLSWRFLSGVPYRSPSPQKASLSATSAPSHPVSPAVRFVFTILECQRWWVGLDWTAALLPGERPSWCSVAHQPFSPPSAFSLPPPSSSFFPLPSGKRLKRTASWRWEEREWGILVNSDGTSVARVERRPPGIVAEEDKDTGSRLKRAATMIRERTASVSAASDKDKERDEGIVPVGTTPDAEDTATDGDGWVYGDNKWEAASGKGGLGKYTRYRRWTRIAILEETVEEAYPGPLGIVREQEMGDTRNILNDAETVAKNATAWEDTSAALRHHESESKPSSCLPTSPTSSPFKNKDPVKDSKSTDDSGGGSALQNRLKSAVKNAR